MSDEHVSAFSRKTQLSGLQQVFALCCGFAGTGKAPHAAASKVARSTAQKRGEGVCEGHSFPGKEDSNGLSIKGCKHSALLWAFEPQRSDLGAPASPNSKRFCSTKWFFPSSGARTSPGGGEREWTCERRALFSSAIKQQQ